MQPAATHASNAPGNLHNNGPGRPGPSLGQNRRDPLFNTRSRMVREKKKEEERKMKTGLRKD